MDPSQRPRERLLAYGPAVLSDAELIALLIRSGRRGRGAVDEAHRLLSDAGGLIHVARLDARELIRRRGLGPAKAAALVAGMELGQRVLRDRLRDGKRLVSPESAGEFLVTRLAKERREIFGFLSLDARHRFLQINELTLGTRNQAPVDPAEVFRRALLDDAAAVVAFHNHPSGDLEPSRDDIGLTRRLVNGGSTIGLPVHDHLIVAAGRWLSLRSVRPRLFEAPPDEGGEGGMQRGRRGQSGDG
jgi:DNA repair protein RadC